MLHGDAASSRQAAGERRLTDDREPALFNIDDEMLAEIVEGSSVPELPAFAPERLRVKS